jgi:hypothetical protein
MNVNKSVFQVVHVILKQEMKSLKHLKTFFSEFGIVITATHIPLSPELPGIYSHNAIVKLIPHSNTLNNLQTIPRKINAGNHEMLCDPDKAPPRCGRCKRIGHIKINCPRNNINMFTNSKPSSPILNQTQNNKQSFTPLNQPNNERELLYDTPVTLDDVIPKEKDYWYCYNRYFVLGQRVEESLESGEVQRRATSMNLQAKLKRDVNMAGFKIWSYGHDGSPKRFKRVLLLQFMWYFYL